MLKMLKIADFWTKMTFSNCARFWKKTSVLKFARLYTLKCTFSCSKVLNHYQLCFVSAVWYRNENDWPTIEVIIKFLLRTKTSMKWQNVNGNGQNDEKIQKSKVLTILSWFCSQNLSKYVAIMFSNVLSQLRTKFRIFALFFNFGMHIFFSLSSSKGIEILLQFSAKLLNFCTKVLKKYSCK